MPFTFNSTPGDAEANSYSTVDDADTYFGGRYPNDKWTKLSTAGKQTVLASATRRLDAEMYNGRPTDTVQRLQFPREVVFDRNSYSYGSNEIPLNLKNATHEYAYFILSADDRIMEEIELHDAAMMDGFKVGPLDYKFGKKAKMDQLPETVKNELVAIGYAVWLGGTQVTNMYR